MQFTISGIRENVSTWTFVWVRDIVLKHGGGSVVAVVPWNYKTRKWTACSNIICDRNIEAGWWFIIHVGTNANTCFFIEQHACDIPYSRVYITNEGSVQSYISRHLNMNSNWRSANKSGISDMDVPGVVNWKCPTLASMDNCVRYFALATDAAFKSDRCMEGVHLRAVEDLDIIHY